MGRLENRLEQSRSNAQSKLELRSPSPTGSGSARQPPMISLPKLNLSTLGNGALSARERRADTNRKVVLVTVDGLVKRKQPRLEKLSARGAGEGAVMIRLPYSADPN